MSGSDDTPPPPPSATPQTQPQQVPHTMSIVKLPILKKGEYDIWAMKMEHYLAHTDYPIWEVIMKGNGPVSITTDTQWIVKVLPLRTVEEALAREKERKARTTLLMALPEDHLAKFHKMTDAKKMTKPGIDDLSSDDLYNNLKVFEYDIKGSNTSSSNSPNVAFVSSIRRGLLFNDADGIDVLNNQDIFDNIQLMGTYHSPNPSPSIPIPDLIPEVSGGEQGGQSSNDGSPSGNEDGLTLQNVYDLFLSLCKQVTAQAKEITTLKAKLKKLRRKARPLISHHQAWVKSVKRKQRLAKKESLKKKRMQKESVSKQGRKSAKAEPSVPKDPAFDDFNDLDGLDYMETEAHTKYGVSTEATVSTDTQKVGIDRAREGTNTVKVSIDEVKESTDKENQGTDSTKVSTDKVEEVLLNMSQAKAVSREKEKGVELKDVENVERQRPTSTRSILTLKPLPKIDPKDTASDDIDETEKKFKMLAHDKEIARKMQQEWEVEEEKNRLATKEAINAALIQELDDVKARIEADRLLEVRLQEEERDQFTVEERARFLLDTITAQRRFLAEQRSAAIQNKPPTKTQLRNQMITYLKHVGGKKHADLKNKNFDDIQPLYERLKRNNDKFLADDSTEDEIKIK
ncbi:hypothetical protein Tco_0774457 [Tanacetum coccineum]|uniref:Uncharacterized protein n=1 Tax=Tanacetum coccineum TaxID=301880 RepID=A0ABQ4ZRA4_9ASTR